MQLLLAGSLRVSGCLITGPPPFPKKLSSDTVFHSLWLGLACGLPKTVTKTCVLCGKEAWTEVRSKIVGGPPVDSNKCRILT